MERLKEKSILVAGGGGIGDELARRYAREGAAVILGDLNHEKAQAVVDEIVKAGGRALAVQLDGTDEHSVGAAVALACKIYGGLDGLHVNFATFLDHRNDVGVMELSLEAFDETMRVNVRGFLVCTRCALPAIIARGGGSILYTSSVAAYRGETTRVAYAMSKGAMLPLMRHVAARHGPDGVRANAIAPGFVNPRLQENLGPEFMQWATSSAHIKARIGRPDDVASVSALLMSDEGSFITGQIINVDGGLIMRA